MGSWVAPLVFQQVLSWFKLIMWWLFEFIIGHLFLEVTDLHLDVFIDGLKVFVLTLKLGVLQLALVELGPNRLHLLHHLFHLFLSPFHIIVLLAFNLLHLFPDPFDLIVLLVFNLNQLLLLQLLRFQNGLEFVGLLNGILTELVLPWNLVQLLLAQFAEIVTILLSGLNLKLKLFYLCILPLNIFVMHDDHLLRRTLKCFVLGFKAAQLFLELEELLAGTIFRFL